LETDGNQCADITFKADAKALAGDACKSNNVTFTAVKEQKADQKTSAGAVAGMNPAVLSSIVGLAVLFVAGMSL